jgi:F-type H+-transporting ATPase subunit delta
MPEFNQTDRAQDTVFDVDAERLARVYAEAGLNAAGGLPEQESLVGEFEAIVDEGLRREPRLAQIFASELISGPDKVAMIERLFAGKVSTTTVNMLKVMARHKRLSLIRDVAKVARKIWNVRAGRVPVQLETANELDPALKQEILTSFARVLAADPIVTQRVNPDLIAGFVIRVGDRVYDGSVRTQLEHMRHGMINRAVEAIQRSGHERFIINSEA